MTSITICATKEYSYALRVQAQAVQNAILEAKRRKIEDNFNIILVTNDNDLAQEIKRLYGELLPSVQFYWVILEINDKAKSHKTKAQQNIARLRSAAFNYAKAIKADYVWSLDSDVLPKYNSLSASYDILRFDNGYYEVASCPYPSQGGGGFLCGRGTFKENILRDIYDDEKEVNPKILGRMKKYEKEVAKFQSKLRKIRGRTPEGDEIFKKMTIVGGKLNLWRKYIRNKAPTKDGNVYRLNSKKWRKRGWLDFAYPAIGKGAIVPSDWTGFGCTLFTAKALNMIDFHGYEGRGTEDLFITWQRWYLNGIKIAAITHCPADHVIRVRGEEDKKVHIFTFHEPDGEFEGHLRQDHREFIGYI